LDSNIQKTASYHIQHTHQNQSQNQNQNPINMSTQGLAFQRRAFLETYPHLNGSNEVCLLPLFSLCPSIVLYPYNHVLRETTTNMNPSDMDGRGRLYARARAPAHKAVAQENLENAGVADRVEIRLGAGLDVLPLLAKDIEEGKKARLGFVYIDADKENNWNYLDRVIALCEQGAVIYVDNIVRGGTVVDPARQDSRTLGARKVVEMAGKDERVDSVAMQFVGEKGYDGMLMAVVR
jgi:hypothetical protein